MLKVNWDSEWKWVPRRSALSKPKRSFSATDLFSDLCPLRGFGLKNEVLKKIFVEIPPKILKRSKRPCVQRLRLSQTPSRSQFSRASAMHAAPGRNTVESRGNNTPASLRTFEYLLLVRTHRSCINSGPICGMKKSHVRTSRGIGR